MPTTPSVLLRDKVIVVTGGAGLLGRIFCRTVIENGGAVIIADMDDQRGEQLAAELETDVTAPHAVYIHLDINDVESIDRLIGAAKRRFGRIDALVNNAYPRNPRYGRKFEDVLWEDFCENVALHLGGYFLASQQFVRVFQEQGNGNIVNMASVYGTVAPRFEIYRNTSMTMPVEYAVIKSGVLQLTKYLSKYLKGSNIRVNAISPGGVLDAQPDTFLQAYRTFCSGKGMLEGNDVSGALLFLLSDLSLFVNGHNLVVDDGFSL